jgi:spore maturation protein CgeB
LRFQKLTTFYPHYLQQFYTERPGLAAKPFESQHEALMLDCFGQADFWAVALSRLGYETQEVVANVEPMQKRWAEERGLVYDEHRWGLDIVAAQVRAFRPELLFVDDHHFFPAPFVRQLRSESPSIRLVLGWCGAPYTDPAIFRECDLVLCCIPEMVEHFRRDGHRSHHLNHAFEPRILERINTDSEPTMDFAFIGSIIIREGFHQERVKLLLDLVEKTELRLWTDSSRPSWQQRAGTLLRRTAYDAVHSADGVAFLKPLLRAAPFTRRVAQWKARPLLPQGIAEPLLRRARPPLFGLRMFQKLQDTRVALNTHIDISPRSASNMRLFEATGIGTCLLTDWKANESELFEPDVEMVSYRSSEECIEKVRYLLDHEDERRRIALAGQRRTLSCHTFAQLDALVRRALSCGTA